MQVVAVVGNGLVERRQVAVDDQVVVPGIVPTHPGGGHAVVLEPHADPQLAALDHGAVGRPDDVGPGILGAGIRFAGAAGWTAGAAS